MKKSVKRVAASLLAVSLVMSTTVAVSGLEVSAAGIPSVSIQQQVDATENCAQILEWLGISRTKHFDSQAPYKVNPLPESNPNYWQTEWETQVYNYKMVRFSMFGTADGLPPLPTAEEVRRVGEWMVQKKMIKAVPAYEDVVAP